MNTITSYLFNNMTSEKIKRNSGSKETNECISFWLIAPDKVIMRINNYNNMARADEKDV